MAWVLQFLVLVFTAALWWLARRDLTANAAEARAPAAEEWTRLRVTVEQLMVELERRAIVAEQRIYEAEQRLRLVEQRLQASFAQADGVPAAPASAANDTPAVPAPVAEPAAPRLATMATEPAPPAMRFAAGTTKPLPADLDVLGNAHPAPAVIEKVHVPSPPPAAHIAPAAAQIAPPPAVVAPPLHLVPEEARYLPVYALLDAGEADAAEIARQTGLPRGEVELVLSLRARRSV